MTKLMTRPVNNFSRLMEPFFDDFFTAPSIFTNGRDEFTPRVDISEKDDQVVMTFEVPGMDKKDVKVMMKDSTLTVSGTREAKVEEENEHVVRREISRGSFERSFTLPKTIDPESIRAEYKNGLLEIVLAKREEAKPKEIEVNVK